MAHDTNEYPYPRSYEHDARERAQAWLNEGSLTEGEAVFHRTYGWGIVASLAPRYITAQFDAGYRKVVPGDELTRTPVRSA